MSFPRYPKYKPSGVEWLGEVPVGWAVIALKRVVNQVRQITYGIVQAGPHVPDGVPYIRPADMSPEGGIEAPDEILRTSAEIAADYSRSTIRTGDLVCSIGPSFGKVMVTPPWLDGANLTQGTARIAVNQEHDAKYIFWTLRAPASVGQWDSSVGGATFRALNLGPLARTIILTPSLAEQTAIAEFLDRETGKIDGLVAEQRRLMELLKEKRQAVISHAVTKGLNPHAPMKPSGIEWLGDVPAGWKIKRVKRLIAILTDYTANGSFASLAENVTYLPAGPSRLVRLTDLREDLKNEGLYVGDYAHAFLAKSELFGGEVLVANVGAYAGYACLMPSGKGKATLGPNMYLIRFRSETISNEYGLLCLMSVGVQEQLKLASTSTAQPKLNKDDVKECVTVIPPTLEEQAEVLSYIKARSLEFDTLTAEAQRAIELLQERRTALISAAVTGQIDVRS